MAPGENLRAIHEDCERIHVILKGNCCVESEDIRADITESYAVFIPSGHEYSMTTGHPGAMVASLNLPALTIQEPYRGRSPYRIENSHAYYLISRLLTSLVTAGVTALSPALLAELAHHLASSRPEGPANGDKLVAPVVEIIHQRALENLSLEELAESARVHPMTLTKKFRQRLGCSIGEFRQRVRAERAFYRVIKTPLSLSELSLICGFSDQSHMTRSFGRFFGITPHGLRLATSHDSSRLCELPANA